MSEHHIGETALFRGIASNGDELTFWAGDIYFRVTRSGAVTTNKTYRDLRTALHDFTQDSAQVVDVPQVVDGGPRPRA